MKNIILGSRFDDFTPTSDIKKVSVDKETGRLYKKSCGEGVDEYFISGTEPKEKCNQKSGKDE